DPKTGNWYQPMKLPSELQEFLDDERGALGLEPEEIQPEQVKREGATPPVGDVEAVARAYPVVGDTVGGLIVRPDIPNQASIEATFGQDFEILEGIREIPTVDTGEVTSPTFVSASERERTERLAEEIKESGEIDPLILAVDAKGDYILEGSHRYDALRLLGITSFPAQVVLDTRSIAEAAPVTPEVPAPTAEEAAAEPAVTPELEELDAASEALIGAGVRLGLNEESIREGAKALARLDNQTVPEAQHVAEATQYLNPQFEVPQARQERFDAFNRAVAPEVAPAPAPIKPKTLPPAPKEVVARRKRNRTSVPKRSKQDVAAIVSAFATYLNSPTTANAMALTEKLRTEERSKRIMRFTNRLRELVVNEGLTKSEAIKQAADETLRGELPSVDPNFFQEVTNEVRDALMDHVYYVLQAENDLGFELLSTYTALSNALAGKPIPRTPGRRGGSAFTRLQRVFGGGAQPLMPALDMVAKQRKPLSDIVRGMY
ncbi:hypothetical protein LCGC14_2526570, partial [marine sediment metagenome]